MQTSRISLLFLIVFMIAVTQASATTFTVSSNPLWSDTGVTIHATDTVTFSNATGSWTWQVGYGPYGPDGSYNPSYKWDEWFQSGNHGALIGFIGNPSLNLNNNPRVISQNEPGLFEIGTNNVIIHGLSGKLWLGFNDDYTNNVIGDNSGTVSVNVTVNRVTMPPILFLLLADP
jgi:hypothetical protein